MAFTNGGFAILAGLSISDGSTPYNQANAYLGVGDDNTVFAATQTNLNPTTGSYGTDRFLAACTSVTRTSSTAILTFVANFTSGQANFAWLENGIFNSGTDGTGTMLTRKVENLGTKTSAATATFTKTLTLSQS